MRLVLCTNLDTKISLPTNTLPQTVKLLVLVCYNIFVIRVYLLIV